MKLILEQKYMISLRSYTVYITPADALTTLEASALAGMVLSPQNRNIPSPASGDLTVLQVSEISESIEMPGRSYRITKPYRVVFLMSCSWVCKILKPQNGIIN